MTHRAYYSASVEKFHSDNNDFILGQLTRHHQFALEDLQRNAWIAQVAILKNSLTRLQDCHLAFEYAIPRMGKRVDVVILYQGVVFVLEFKVGERAYPSAAIEQGLDYSVDLKNFHVIYRGRNTINYYNRYALDAGVVDEIRRATRSNYALGNTVFAQQVELALGRRVTAGKGGRPKRKLKGIASD